MKLFFSLKGFENPTVVSELSAGGAISVEYLLNSREINCGSDQNVVLVRYTKDNIPAVNDVNLRIDAVVQDFEMVAVVCHIDGNGNLQSSGVSSLRTPR